MLDRWGYLYFSTANELTYAETALEHQRARTGGAIAGHGTSILDPNGPDADLVAQKCYEVLRTLHEHLNELGPVSHHLEVLRNKIINSKKPHQLELYTNDILDDVRRILNDLRVILSQKKFYYLPQTLSSFYGNPLLFGEVVAKKFPKACPDIERAGNCLALGEATACVLHLNRVMEIAIRRLAKKLKFDPKPRDTFGAVLRDMSPKIDALPEHTEKLKRKKEKWSECRTNLFHVKNAWRDPSSHGKVSYSEKEARDIIQRVEGFMQQLATLL
ncbi:MULTISPECIES: hypothetical protein [unclassified Bradyrhizobium]|uniref:hypothetical protein n=1 Tax=unclassified Bradyrhizobium TaxID=2631580 RepID=UPI0029166E3B|nr:MULTISPECIES: hypothetical protein [unclassified Bradyrhizobium]